MEYPSDHGVTTSETDDITFDVPSDPSAARSRLATLQDDIESIQYQLSDPDKRKDSGRRMSSKQYMKWRRGAIKALTAKKRELRRLKQWIREYEQKTKATMLNVDPKSAEELLAAANNIIQQMKVSGVDFTDTELTAADLIRDYVLGVTDRS